MEDDDEDNMYAPADSAESGQVVHEKDGIESAPVKREGRNDEDDGEEEGEEVEEDETDSVGTAITSFFSKYLIVWS